MRALCVLVAAALFTLSSIAGARPPFMPRGGIQSSASSTYLDLCSTPALSGTCVYPLSIVHRLASTATNAMVVERQSDSTDATIGFVNAANGPPAAAASGVPGIWVDRKSYDAFCSGTTCRLKQVIAQDGSGCSPSQSVWANMLPLYVSPVYGTLESWSPQNGVPLASANQLTTSGQGGQGGGSVDCPALAGSVAKSIIGFSNNSYPSQVGGQMGIIESSAGSTTDPGAMFSFMFCQTASFCGPKSFGLDQEQGGAWAEIPNPPADGVGIATFSGAAATFKASISGTTMTVVSSPAVVGALAVGQTVISFPSLSANTTVVAQLTGTPGGAGTYTVSPSQSAPSKMMSSGLVSGPLAGRNVLNIFWNGSQIVTNVHPNGPILTETRMKIGGDGDTKFNGPVWIRDLLFSSADVTAVQGAISAYETNLYQTLANTKAINFISLSGSGNFTAGVAGTISGYVAPQDTPALGPFSGTFTLVSTGTSWDGVSCASTNLSNFQISPNGAITTRVALSSGTMTPVTYSGVCVSATMGGVSYTQEFTLTAMPRAANTVTVTNTSGGTVMNYPLQFGRPFFAGAIPAGNQDCIGTGSVANGVLTFTSPQTCAVGDVVTWAGATVAAPVITGGSGTSYTLTNTGAMTGSTTITGLLQQCPTMSINGSPATSQFDVKNRYADGSVSFGIGAVVIPSIANNASAVVTFLPGSCNNTPLTVAQMTGGSYNFDAKITLAAPAQLLGIAQSTANTCSNFVPVTNGGFSITVNGTPYTLSGMNFSAVTNCPQVGAIIQKAMQTAGALVRVSVINDAVAGNPRFQIVTSTSGTGGASLSYAGVPAGGVTDISGSGFLGWTSTTVGTGGTWLAGYSPTLTGSTAVISAKTIMQAAGSNCAAPGSVVGSSPCILWTSGGVAQEVELTDESPAFAYDVGFDGTHKPFHPKIYATFWPALNQFQVRFAGEDDYTTLSSDLNYVLSLSVGATSPVTVYTKDLTSTGNIAGIISSGFTSNSAIAAGAGGTINFSGTPSPALTANAFYQMLDKNTGEWTVVKANSGGTSAAIQSRGGARGDPSFPIAVGDPLVMGSSAVHWFQTRWTRSAWSGTAPASQVSIDGNLAYLASTRWLPNYDASFALNASSVSNEVSFYTQNPNDIYDGLWDQPSNSTTWNNGMGSEGARQDIGPYPQWTAMWFHNGDPGLRQVALGLADQASSWPLQLRENATGKRYLITDTPGSSTGLGHDIPKIDRPAAFGGQFYSWGPASSNLTKPMGALSRSPWTADGAHQPAPFFPQYVLTGDPWYLEQLLSWASDDAFDCWGGSPAQLQGCGPYNASLATQTVYGGAVNDQLRGDGWVNRNRAEAAFAQPDGSVEQTYLNALTIEGIARWEGNLHLTGTPLDGTPEKVWAIGIGNNHTTTAGPFVGSTPVLHNWESICDPTQPDAPCGNDLEPTWLNEGIAGSETAVWQQAYVSYSHGRLLELGYPASAVDVWSDQFWNNLINISGYPQLIGWYYWSPLKFGSSGYYTTWDNVSGLQTALNLTDTCCGTAPPGSGAGYSSYFNQNLVNGRPTWLAPGMAMIADQDQPGGALAYSWYQRYVYGVTAQGGYSNCACNAWAIDPRWAIIPRTDTNIMAAPPSFLGTWQDPSGATWLDASGAAWMFK